LGKFHEKMQTFYREGHLGTAHTQMRMNFTSIESTGGMGVLPKTTSTRGVDDESGKPHVLFPKLRTGPERGEGAVIGDKGRQIRNQK